MSKIDENIGSSKPPGDGLSLSWTVVKFLQSPDPSLFQTSIFLHILRIGFAGLAVSVAL